ncbi:hypothetical protein EST38_g4782 [Candolleomyces aberdarensis]|uniref:Nephrocystin 3-like N-terminal domain-containing protein n=1 Tax=Candolleomyces aberdarensis TaxID=2316362 RepID=A0A4Q2DQ33_9AGAR|nr:hypothetical protein EST38_g4782 [Candolleomyces aberdarensis]
MAPKPKSKQFSFRRFLGLRRDSPDTPSAVRQQSEAQSSSRTPTSFSRAQHLEPSTVAETGRSDGIANAGSSTSQSSNNPAFFANSSHFVVQIMKVVDASQHHTSSHNASEGQPSPSFLQMQVFMTSFILGWKVLLEKVAPAALHNSEARYDPPKCDEDTRVEVISEIMSWITANRDAPSSQQRLLCMTGAAGSGKSALQQTIAERCASEEPGILGATFFFCAADQTRNSVLAVVPTIAYQLALRHGLLRLLIVAAVDNDPLIFSKSLRTQMRTLIIDPVEGLGRQEGGSGPSFLPHAILIDGLDECKDEDRQTELLLAIKECFVDTSTPFRLFISSRPEWAIRSALKPGGHLHGAAYRIQLSDQYDATADIRRFLWRRLLALIPQDDESGPWFSEADVERLVEAASGQFVYAATVIRFLSERRASPVKRLNTLLTWISSGSGNNPLSALDNLYTQIVTSAKTTYETAVDQDGGEGDRFLLLLRSYQLSSLYDPILDVVPIQDWDMLLSGELNTHELILSDLRSLMTTVELKQISKFGNSFPAPGSRPFALYIYHKSFIDFCGDQSRAKDLYFPDSRVREYYALCCIQHMHQCPLHLGTFPFSPFLVVSYSRKYQVRYIGRVPWEPWKAGTSRGFKFSFSLLSNLFRRRTGPPLGSPSLDLLLQRDMLEKMDKWLEGYCKAERYFLDRWVKFTTQILDESKVRTNSVT